MLPQKRILVIGAGASGLAAIKSCKEECLKVECYERTNNFGGRWRYTEQSIRGQASVMKSTVCKYSKEIGAYSDFPPPADFPNYLHHTKMLEYLTLYAQKFDLIHHIKYQTEVIRISPSQEYDKNGKWSVTSKNISSNSEFTEEFDAIMVCTGRLSNPVIPHFPGVDLFSGLILHSQTVKRTEAFENLKVLVVGNGNSAVDAAVELSTFSEQVYLSTRNGFWLYPKVGPKGLPYDMHLIRRDMHFLKMFCSDVANHCVEKYLETKINHEECMIKPSHRAMDKHPTINDDLPDKVLTGRIMIKDQILKFTKHGVIFHNEDNITEIDCIIFATGYAMEFPFIDSSIYIKNNGTSNLYKYVFPVGLKHSTLAFIGFVESNGPQIPISESQTRWVSRIFSKRTPFPTQETVEKHATSLSSKKNFKDLTVDIIEYMDELAEEYGVKPDISSLLFKDASLFWACFSGPFLPYQYRLVGPNNLKNARNLILECGLRIKEALNTRSACKSSSK